MQFPLAGKRITKGDSEFLKLLDGVASVMEFDLAQLLSFAPSLFRLVPDALLGLKRKEKTRQHFYLYMKVIRSSNYEFVTLLFSNFCLF